MGSDTTPRDYPSTRDSSNSAEHRIRCGDSRLIALGARVPRDEFTRRPLGAAFPAVIARITPREAASCKSNFALGMAVDLWMHAHAGAFWSRWISRDKGRASVRRLGINAHARLPLKASRPLLNDGHMADEPVVSPFSRPPAPPKTFSRQPAPPKTFTRPVTPNPTVTSQPITVPKPAGPIEVAENLPLGFMAGLVAAVIGAGLWALVTIVTGFQIGWMAVGVGFLVGWAVRMAGKGTHRAFGIMGALLALSGCAFGNLLTILVLAAQQFGVSLLAVVTRVTPDVVVNLMQLTFRPMDLLFYGIAIYEGYRFSIVGGTE
jgi:hypothetical protein